MGRRIQFALLVMLLSAVAAQANSLVVNGSFETPVVPVGGFTNFISGSTDITGRTVVGREASIVSDKFVSLGISFPAEDGVQWLDLTGDVSNVVEGVEQNIATTPGLGRVCASREVA